MTKAELVDKTFDSVILVYNNNHRKICPFTREDILMVTEELLRTMNKAFLANEDIDLRGFGSFNIKTCKERKNARNPRTGEIVTIAEHKKVVFKESKNKIYN